MADESETQRVSFRAERASYRLLVKGDTYSMNIDEPGKLEKRKELIRFLRTLYGERRKAGRPPGSNQYSPEMCDALAREALALRAEGVPWEEMKRA